MLQLGLVALLASPLPWAVPAPGEPTPIYGGETVEPGTWPSTVGIVLPGTLCTGTLVSDKVVLTAAHCLEHDPSPSQMHVALGDDVYSPKRTIGVVGYGIHPDYCGSDTTKCKVDVWDYGYLLLEEPAGVTPTRPLTRQDEWDEAMRVGSPVTLVGYGENEKMLAGIKRQVEAEIVRFSGSGLEFQAGGMGVDTCQGDSGGPAFVTLGSGEVVLAGVTSRGYSCGNGGFYAIPYASLCWLNEETGVDLRTDACDACDCLAIAPGEEEQCGCAADDPAGPLGLALLVLWGGLRRPGARPSRRSRP